MPNNTPTNESSFSRRDFIKKGVGSGLALSLAGTALANAKDGAGKKNIHIIYGDSTHNKACHNNVEVASLIKFKLEQSKFKDKFTVTTSYMYPKDETLVEEADLVIISSDGGGGHALKPKEKGAEITRDMKKLDAVLKRNKTGLIVIHWATDAPSDGFGRPQAENDKIMSEWIGACYFWGSKEHPRDASWTKKPMVVELEVNPDTPLANGLPKKFKLQDEYYYNFFSDGVKSKRNLVNKKVYPVHLSMMGGKGNKNRLQPVYWGFTRENKARSVGMTSAHFYHSWANPNFFKTFVNSIFWTLGMEVPKNGVDIATPTLEELLAQGKNVAIDPNAQHFT